MKRRIVLASRNEGKLREMQSLFEPVDWELVSQPLLNIPSAPETGITFLENALEKARHVSRATGLPALADDSGLVVTALGGAPGVYSARYAGPTASDNDNNAKLLGALKGIRDRRAHFFCVLVFLEHAEHPAPIVARGIWSGRICEAPAGSHGFGYDPVFIPDGELRTAAELPPELKNAKSHRGLAARALIAMLSS